MSELAPEDIGSHLYQIFSGYLPHCGCGNPDASNRLAHRLLQLAPFYEDDRATAVRELCGPPGAAQLILAALEGAGLTEHGGSLWSSWLTDRGRWTLWAVEQVGGIDALDAVLEEFGYPHDGAAECRDSCWIIPPERT